MSVTYRRAVREKAPLILGVAGPSGGGKTFSALRLASGIAGGQPFAVADTENGRAKHYAPPEGCPPGPGQFLFDHTNITPPFRPAAYLAAIEAAERAGYTVLVIDSMSHEHAGEGGLLDWQEAELARITKGNPERRDACKMAAWIEPKRAHKKLVNHLLQLRMHLILCFRAEQKIDMVRKDGKTEVVPKTILSGFSDWIPIAEKNILFELTASFLLTPDAPGVPKPIKLESQLRPCIKLDKQLDEATGAEFAAWANAGAEPVRAAKDTARAHEGGAGGKPAAESAGDKPAGPPSDNEAENLEHHRGRLRAAGTRKALNDIFSKLPKSTQAACYSTYNARMGELSKGR